MSSLKRNLIAQIPMDVIRIVMSLVIYSGIHANKLGASQKPEQFNV